MRAREQESPELLSNRWHTLEHKDNSPQGDRNSTKLAASFAVAQEGKREPAQLPEACRRRDKDISATDTSTMQDLRSTTNQAESRAIRETSARRAKRRCRAHENDRFRRAKQVQASPDQERATQSPSVKQTKEPK